ncbi:MEDS domain-containing protein [Nitrospira moscoviensis]|uniref:MEDS domain-containing protein n=1 Tax=Nitrospira moscoviensis TaxID=42253 RepID=UPI0006A758E0|nr:MEDS domain-containing protein [Nitrospira moscoviensis]
MPSHAVKFYEDDAFLIEAVSAFILTGLQARGGVVVIATARHLEELDKAMAFGVRPSAGTLLLLDAHEMLARIVVESRPSEPRFLTVFGELVDTASQEGPVRIFGEMVAVLAEQGRIGAALHLEELWNRLGATRPFSLLCAYPLGVFAPGAGTDAFLDVCAAHDRLLTTASHSCPVAMEA